MRYALALVLLASACSPDLSGQVSQLRADVDALRAQLGATVDPSVSMDTVIARVAAVEGRIAALETKVGALAPVKVPHLIVSATGEDLGPFVDWSHAYSAQLGAYYAIGSGVIYWTGPDCTGEARIIASVDLVSAPDGTIYRVDLANAPQVDFQSRGKPGACAESINTYNAATFTDTGAVGFGGPPGVGHALGVALR